MLFLWEKQQFTCTHKMMDDLICSVENFKALIEFKGQVFWRRQTSTMNGTTERTM